ncbi:fatty acid desaturase [Parvularcula sp. IMCC14364]|uniref:fatty acid desaturase n=1 Tax=Parvularcula sp. IMCC14364 TaxID=3067902 RepID=UPI0027415550|nr:fatty acid desaturase [Parvularcula sp. IMCC14364]
MSNLGLLVNLRADAKQETGRFAWVTFWLGVGTLLVIITATALALSGVMPLWLAGMINLAAFVAGYTVGHEIIHDSLIGRHTHLSWLNVFFGTLFFSVPFHSLTMHRYIHLRHHSHTNDPEKDPDAWISGRNSFALLLRLLTHYPHYQYHVIKWTRDMPARAAFLTRCLLEQTVPMAIAAVLILSGYGAEVFWMWILPSFLVYPVLAFILDWAPHHDLEVGTPLDNSRLLGTPQGVRGQLFTWLYLFQNYHLIHHLYPKVPFYRYKSLYERHSEELIAAGAAIYPGFDQKS